MKPRNNECPASGLGRQGLRPKKNRDAKRLGGEERRERVKNRENERVGRERGWREKKR